MALTYRIEQLIQEEPKSINKRHPAFFANIIHVLGSVLPEWYPQHP